MNEIKTNFSRVVFTFVYAQILFFASGLSFSLKFICCKLRSPKRKDKYNENKVNGLHILKVDYYTCEAMCYSTNFLFFQPKSQILLRLSRNYCCGLKQQYLLRRICCIKLAIRYFVAPLIFSCTFTAY